MTVRILAALVVCLSLQAQVKLRSVYVDQSAALNNNCVPQYNTTTKIFNCTGVSASWGAIAGSIASQADLQSAFNLKANLASPAFSGTPTAPTVSLGDNSTAIATTAWVRGQGFGTPAWGAISGTLTSQSDLNSALGLKAPLASPAFTGSPTAPTQSAADNSTLIATTAWVRLQRIPRSVTTDQTGACTSPDYALNTVNGSLFVCPTGTNVWQTLGATGPVGPQGADGGIGLTGPPGPTGPAVDFDLVSSTPSGGTDGGMRVQINTGDVWKRASGTWSVYGQLTAAKLVGTGADPSMVMASQVFPSFPTVDGSLQCSGTSDVLKQFGFDSANSDHFSQLDCNGTKRAYFRIGDVLAASGGGTGLSSLPTANQVLGVNNAGSAYEGKTITAGANVTVTNTAGAITIASTGGGGGGGNGGGGGYSQSFTSQTSVTLTHNLGTNNLNLSCLDGSENGIQPNNWAIGASAPYDVTVTFTNAQTGRCVVTGMGKYSATFTSVTSLTIPASTHGFGSCDLHVRLWDNSSPRKIIEANDITCDTTTRDVVITFAAAQSGKYVIN